MKIVYRLALCEMHKRERAGLAFSELSVRRKLRQDLT